MSRKYFAGNALSKITGIFRLSLQFSFPKLLLMYGEYLKDLEYVDQEDKIKIKSKLNLGEVSKGGIAWNPYWDIILGPKFFSDATTLFSSNLCWSIIGRSKTNVGQTRSIL